MGKCKHCGYENSHKQSCTPETRAAADQERIAGNKKLHDASMDDRTRADQSHTRHGNKNFGSKEEKHAARKSRRGK